MGRGDLPEFLLKTTPAPDKKAEDIPDFLKKKDGGVSATFGGIGKTLSDVGSSQSNGEVLLEETPIYSIKPVGGALQKMGTLKIPKKEVFPLKGTPATKQYQDIQNRYAKATEVEVDADDPVRSLITPIENKLAERRNKPAVSTTGTPVSRMAGNIEASQLMNAKKEVEGLRFNDAKEAEDFLDTKLDKSKLVRTGQLDMTKAPSLDDFSEESILAGIPKENMTAQVAANQYLQNRKMKNIVASSSSLEDAALKYAMSKGDVTGKQITELGGNVPNSMKGNMIMDFVQNQDLQELASKDSKLAQDIKEEMYNFPQHYPSAAIRMLTQILSDEREKRGFNNGIINFTSPSTSDEIVDELVESGQLPLQYKALYQDPSVRFLVNANLKTPGLVENVGTGIEQGVTGIGKTVADVTGVRDLYSDKKDRLFAALDKQYSDFTFKPKSLMHRITTSGGNIIGQQLPMLGGGAVLRGAGLVKNASTANSIMAGIQTFGENRDRALVDLPGESEEKQFAYATLNTGIEMVLANVMNDAKLAKSLVKRASPEIKTILNKFTNKEISAAAAKEATQNVFGKLLSASEKFAKGTVGTARKEATEEAATQILQTANNQVFGGEPITTSQALEDAFDVFTTTFLGGLVMGVGGGVVEVNKNKEMPNLIYEMASNPDKYIDIIEGQAAIDKEYAKDASKKIENLEYIASVKNVLDSRQDIKENDKKKVLLKSLSQKIITEENEAIPDKSLRANNDKILAELEIEKQIALNPKMSNTEVVQMFYDKGILDKGSMNTLEGGEKKFNEANVGTYLKEIAQQANNLDENWQPNETEKPASLENVPIAIIELANKRWEKEIDAAEEKRFAQIDPIRELDMGTEPLGGEEVVKYEDAIKITPTSELSNPEKYGTDELGMEAKTAALRDEEKTPPKFTDYKIGTYARDRFGDLYQLQNVPIDKIVLPEGEQKREDVVEKYKQWYNEGSKFPPLKGVENFAIYDGKVVVSDGHHRAVAAKQLGLKEVPLWVSLTDPQNPAKPITDIDYHKSIIQEQSPKTVSEVGGKESSERGAPVENEQAGKGVFRPTSVKKPVMFSNAEEAYNYIKKTSGIVTIDLLKHNRELTAQNNDINEKDKANTLAALDRYISEIQLIEKSKEVANEIKEAYRDEFLKDPETGLSEIYQQLSNKDSEKTTRRVFGDTISNIAIEFNKLQSNETTKETDLSTKPLLAEKELGAEEEIDTDSRKPKTKKEIDALPEKEREAAIDDLIFGGEGEMSPEDIANPKEAIIIPAFPKANGTVKEVLRHLIDNKNKFSELAQQILDTADEKSLAAAVEFGHTLRQRRSMYLTNSDKVTMDLKDGKNATVIIHEIIHAATSKKIPTNLKNPSHGNSYGKAYYKQLLSYLKDEKSDNRVKQLIRLYLKAVDAMGFKKQLFEGDEQIRENKYSINKIKGDDSLFGSFQSSTEANRVKNAIKKIVGEENIKVWAAGYRHGYRYGYKMKINPEGVEKLKNSNLYKEETYDAIRFVGSQAQKIKSTQEYIVFNDVLKSKATAGNADLTLEKGAPYGLGNLDEFLAEAFSSESFQRELAKIKDDNGVSLWQKFVTAIKNLLGIETEGTLLNSVIKTGAQIISQNRDAAIERMAELQSPSNVNLEAAKKRMRDAGFSDAEIKKEFEKRGLVFTDSGATRPPEKGQAKVAVYAERPGTELSFRGLQNVANEFGLSDVESREKKNDIQLFADARNTMKEWADSGKYAKNIERLLTAVENRELNLLDEQRVILQQHLANEVQQLRDITDKNSEEWKMQFEVVKRIKEVGNIARSESGAALRIPIGGYSHPVKDFGDAMVAMQEANGGKELTEAQKSEVERYVKNYEDKLKIADEKVAAAEAKYAELQAQKEVGEVSKKYRKSNKDFSSERKQIVENIREKLKKVRSESTVTVLPYAKELFAIAPDVAKLVKSMVEQGVNKLEDLVTEIHSLIKDEIVGIKETDVVDLIAGKYNEVKDTKADLEKKLKQIKDKKSAEAVKIRARIKSGDFAKPEKRVSWVNDSELKIKYPKLYNEALDALDAKEQAQLDFDIAVFKREQANRSKIRKGIDVGRSLIATTKAIKSGIDDSAVMMQNIVAMISHPRSAVKALREHALDAVSEKRFRRYLTELHNSPIWDLIEKSGLDITDPKSLKEQNKEEIFDNNLLNKDIKIRGKKYNIGKYVTRPFERAFTSLGNAMRVNMFTRIAERWLDEGKTFDTHPEDYKSLATLLNTETGRGKLHTQVQRASQLITAGIWSPRLMASRINMLGLSELAPLYGGKGYYAGMTPDIRKMALMDMVKFIGAGVALMMLAGINGAEIDDDPESPTFGTIRIGDKKYNAWGGFAPYVKTIYQGITNHRNIDGRRKEVKRSELLFKFFRSRLTPAAGVATNLLSGSDYSGKPVTVLSELQNLAMPLSVNSVIEAVKKDGVMGILTEGIPSFIGINVSDERDYQKKDKPKATNINF